MKVYVIYQLGYTGSNELEILGVYQDRIEANEIYLKAIKENIDNFDFYYDAECTHRFYNNDKTVMTRLFKGGYQENWDNYLEIYMETQEVK